MEASGDHSYLVNSEKTLPQEGSCVWLGRVTQTNSVASRLLSLLPSVDYFCLFALLFWKWSARFGRGLRMNVEPGSEGLREGAVPPGALSAKVLAL